MTRDKVIDIIELITLEYDFELTAKMVDLWEELLSDIPDALGVLAAKSVILKSAFRPKIADIRREALALMNPESEIDAGRAWELILKAIRRFGYSQESQALSSLPASVASAAKRFGWLDLCSGEEMVNRAHFLKLFESMQTREKAVGVLPPALQAHYRQAALESAPVSVRDIVEKALPQQPAALPTYTPPTETRSSGYTPPKNVLPFRRKAQTRSVEELQQQADLLRQQAIMSRESAEFKAMTEAERAEHLKQQAQQLGGAA